MEERSCPIFPVIEKEIDVKIEIDAEQSWWETLEVEKLERLRLRDKGLGCFEFLSVFPSYS